MASSRGNTRKSGIGKGRELGQPKARSYIAKDLNSLKLLRWM